MRRSNSSVQFLLNLLHLPFSTPRILPTPLAIMVRNPTFPEPTPPPPRPAQALSQNPSCALLSQALSICAVLTPGFVTLPPPAQAHCLCYSSTVWAPKVLDDAVKTCADYASTAAPGAFGPLLNLEGFCMSVGDLSKDAPAGVQANITAGNGAFGGGSGNSGGITASPASSALIPSYGGANNGGGSSAGHNGGHGDSGDGSDGSGSSGGANGNNGSGTRGSGGTVGNIASTTTSAASSGSTSSSGTGFPGISSTRTPTTMDITTTVNSEGATNAGDGAVRNRGEVTEAQVVLVSLAIAVLILFL